MAVRTGLNPGLMMCVINKSKLKSLQFVNFKSLKVFLSCVKEKSSPMWVEVKAQSNQK